MDKYADIPLYIAHAILLYTSNHVLVTPNAQSYMKSDTVLFQKKKKTPTPLQKESYACTVQTLSSSYSILCLIDCQVGHADIKGQLHLSCGGCFSILLCWLLCFCIWMETYILEGVTLLAFFLGISIEQSSAMRDSMWVGERDQTPTER